jgi:hypothetical protein
MWTNVADKKLLTEVLELSWKGLATKKQVQAYDEQKAASF